MYYDIYDLYDVRDLMDKTFGVDMSDIIMRAIDREIDNRVISILELR